MNVQDRGFPGGTSGKELVCQCRRCKRSEFGPWVGKIPWRRAWQPTPAFLPGDSPWTEESGGLQSTGSQSRIRPKQQHTCTRDIPTLVFIAALFIILKNWKHKCSSRRGCLKKKKRRGCLNTFLYIHTVECYTAFTKYQEDLYVLA